MRAENLSRLLAAAAAIGSMSVRGQEAPPALMYEKWPGSSNSSHSGHSFGRKGEGAKRKAKARKARRARKMAQKRSRA